MARQNIEEMLEKKVSRLREGEKAKKEELAEIQKELRRYTAALESLNGNFPPVSRKRKSREEAKDDNPD
jgi:hypothetical protein